MVFIIAEAGVNHNGSIELAYNLIDAAVAAGVDAIKFQTYKTENVVTKDSPNPAYQEKSKGFNAKSQYDMLKELELTFEEFRELKDYCDKKNIMFMSTADEIDSAIFLDELQNVFKVGSAELTDIPFLRKLASFNKPVILSTGMAYLKEIEIAVNTLVDYGLEKDMITILHCNSDYPSPYEDVNLSAMATMRNILGVNIGYSDHTLGLEVPIAAVALGAKVIEKHFTTDNNLPGPDHQMSLNPEELKQLVRSVRITEKVLGNSEKMPTPSELSNIKLIRKSIVAKTPIKKGDVFSEKNLTVKRPGFGIGPEHWDNILGNFATRNYAEDELISNE